VQTLSPTVQEIWSLKWLQDDRIASAGADKDINFWSVITRSLVHTITGAHQGRIQALELLPNGYLASGGCFPDYALKLWNTTSYSVVYSINNAHESNCVNFLKALPNGYLASAGFDCLVKVWNSTLGLVHQFGGFSNSASSVEYLLNDVLLGGNWDGTIQSWNVTTGAFLSSYNPFGNRVNALKLLPNNNVAIGGPTLQIWDTLGPGTNFNLGSPIYSFALFSGQLLLAGLANGKVQVIDMDNNYQILASLYSSASCSSTVNSLEVPGKIHLFI
jgi:WD40 repeat protein